MEIKKIDVILDCVDEKVKLIFKLSSGDSVLNLESDNSEEIKVMFLNLIKEIEINPIELNLVIGENFNESENKLFKDTVEEFMEQLKTEIINLELDENLIKIRQTLE